MRLIDADAFIRFIKDVSKRQKYGEVPIDKNLTVEDVLDAVVASLENKGLAEGDTPTIVSADRYMERINRMKAILVMEMPNNCNECPLLNYEYGCPIIGATGDRSQGRSEMCPLKQIPDCPDVPETISNDVAYILGWNDCIAEILRNENSKNR